MCLLDSDGRVHCASGSPDGGVVRWDQVPLPGRARDVALIPNGGCVLLESGRLACWGHSWSECVDPSTARVLERPRGIVRIASDQSGLVASDATGLVHRWGSDCIVDIVELGGGRTSARYPSPQLIYSREDYGSEPSALFEFCGSCVVDSRRTLRCAGEGTRRVPQLDPRPQVMEAASGQGRLCAIDADRSLWCWEPDDVLYADRVQWYWYQRLPGPVRRLRDSSHLLCVDRPGDAACLAPYLGQASFSREPLDPRGRRDWFHSLPRPEGSQLLLLGRRACLVAESGRLTCPPDVARQLAPAWAVDELR